MKRLAEIIGAKAYALDQEDKTGFYESEEQAVKEITQTFQEGVGPVLLESISEFIFEETNFNIDPSI